jgi:hypothetical protein
MDIEQLRHDLHTAVDRIIEDYLATDSSSARSSGAGSAPTVDAPLIVRGEDLGEWAYRWPGNEGMESFYASKQYEVITPHRTYRVRLAWSVRPAWGRRDRKRAIVFGQSALATSTTYYPWTEFVETDSGGYAASIPNPEHPRKILMPSDQLPTAFRGARVERNDQLFDQIVNGPSLRIVVDAAEEEDMVRHGYWVARRRNRL